MPNYLNGEIATGGMTVGESNTGGSNFDNVGAHTSAQSNARGLPPVSFSPFGGGIGMGGGSKPAALHTEYALGDENGGDDGGPSYGTQDIVFYLQRADAPDGEETESEVSKEQAGAGIGGIAGDAATGPNADNGQIPSGSNQIAVGGGVGGSIGGTSGDGGAMAPVGGMTITDEEEIGTFSQNASRYVDVTAAAANAVRHVESLGSDYERLSLSASERLFSHVLSKGFIPESDLTGNRSEEEILQTLDRPSFAELAFQLARATGGRCRAKDIVKAVNDGRIGLVNEKAKAFQQRNGMRKGSSR